MQLLLKVGHHRKKPWTNFINDANRHLASPEALAFLDGCLRFDHQQRWTTQEALQQPYFDPVREEVAAQQEQQRQEQQRQQQQRAQEAQEVQLDQQQQQIDGQSMEGVEEDGEGAGGDGDAAIAAAAGGGGRRSGTRPVPAPADQGRSKRVYARRKRQ
jgi:casein kinase II subunit alpha